MYGKQRSGQQSGAPAGRQTGRRFCHQHAAAGMKDDVCGVVGGRSQSSQRVVQPERQHGQGPVGAVRSGVLERSTPEVVPQEVRQW